MDNPNWNVGVGDCRALMAAMPEASVDSIVTDPPYGLSFMGKGCDHAVPGVDYWTAALRVAKPGAHLLAFGGTRTFHRLACAIEDAGWELRDTLMWVYGSGFPKSLDVSKAIDKAAGVEREVVGQKTAGIANPSDRDRHTVGGSCSVLVNITTPATEAARQWQGWGTALKPAWEPVIMARKPLDGTVAANMLKHGTGAINVDACRVGTEAVQVNAYGGRGPFGESQSGNNYTSKTVTGRWPANLAHDGSDEVVAGFPQESARYFYCAKASRADREAGLREAGLSVEAQRRMLGGFPNDPCHRSAMNVRNTHPTVKPTALMQWLCRLVTRPGGLILDPFTGSGSTGKAAILEGFRFTGCEIDPHYAEIARARIAHADAEASQFLGRSNVTHATAAL